LSRCLLESQVKQYAGSQGPLVVGEGTRAHNSLVFEERRSGRGVRLIIVLVGAGFLAQSSAFAQSLSSAASASSAQTAPAQTPEPDRRWSVSVDLLGFFSTGGAGELEDAMRSAHFGDTIPGFFGPTPTPFSGTSCQGFLPRSCGAGLPAFEVDRQLKNPWSIAGVFSRTVIATTAGYHDAGVQYLDLDHRVDSVGALLSIGNHAGELGIGPALHIVQISQTAPGGNQAWTDHAKLGFIARARATVPARSRIFLDLRAEYHFTGHATIGPYTPAGFGGSPATFPSTPVAFNYWFGAAGAGVRF